MPQRNDEQEFLRDIERDEKGRFQSRAKQTDALKTKTAELNAQLQKQSALIAQLQAQQSKTPKLDKEIAAGMQAQVKLLREQTKGAEQALKSYEKMQRQTLALQERMLRSRQQIAKALPPERASAGAGGSGFHLGFALPAFLSVAAIEMATKSLIHYIEQLARVRDMSRALGGRLPELPYQRDQEIYAKYATQNFANRFSSPQEIAGLKALRDKLTDALGPQAGEAITLKLTDSLKGSTEELQRFLALASRDVPTALKLFESADIETFATALKAATQETDEWSKAASNLEKLWIDIQQIGEQLAGIVAPIFGDIAAKLRDATQEGSHFRVALIDAAEAGVKGLYKVADEFRLGGIAALDLLAILHKVKYEMMFIAQADPMDLLKEISDTHAVEQMKDQLAASIGKAPSRDLDKYFADLRERAAQIPPPVNDTTKALNAAQQAAQKARQEIEKTATPAERVALATQKMSQHLEVSEAELKVAKSALSAAESSPFGFANAYALRIQAAQKLNEQIGTLREQLAAINSLENQTRADRLRALGIEDAINQKIAERNGLLQAQYRGYLDAVQQQAFAAGRFEKIITSQQLNTAMALEKGIAKKNPLIGQVGKDAERYSVEPFRYGTDMQGNLQGLQKYQEDLAKNIGGAGAIGMKPTAGEQQIITAIGETNKLLADGLNQPIPRSQAETDIALGKAQSSVMTNRMGHLPRMPNFKKLLMAHWAAEGQYLWKDPQSIQPHTTIQPNDGALTHGQTKSSTSTTRASATSGGSETGVKDMRQGLALMSRGLDRIEPLLDEITSETPGVSSRHSGLSGGSVLPH